MRSVAKLSQLKSLVSKQIDNSLREQINALVDLLRQVCLQTDSHALR